ncbi:MAG TPA: IclR family transcriptional regulator [Terriglobia bacterium]|nr:IclR family transcriptional regulator [Terriglobia bacterium]
MYRIRVLDRVFKLLDILAKDNRELGLVEITNGLGLHKSSVHRLLMVLEDFQYVSRNPVTGKYGLGGKLIELGMKAVSRLDLYQAARPYLERLVAGTGETAHVGVLREGEIISVVNVQSSQTLRLPSTVGRRAPVHCSSLGKAILAFLPESEVRDVLGTRAFKAYTRKTIIKPVLLRKELKKVREQGYACDDEEFEEGLRCIGAPIRDHTGKVIAAISIAGPAFRLKDERLPGLVRAVKEAATALSVNLGYPQ